MERILYRKTFNNNLDRLSPPVEILKPVAVLPVGEMAKRVIMYP